MNKDGLRKILFFCLYLILITINSYSQSNNIEFDHYTTNDGLSNGFINTLLEDSKGFMWIGTSNGLNRFDGITFKTYYFNPDDSTSLSGSKINYLIEDFNGFIWVMTNRSICLYNREKDWFARKSLSINNKKIDNLYVYTSFIDSQGFMWVSSPDGIYRFNLNDKNAIALNLIDAELFSIPENDLKSLKNRVYSIIEDDKKIWVASNSQNLFYFDSSANKFIAYPVSHPDVNKFSNKGKMLIKDRDGDFFMTIIGFGLMKWDRKGNIFTLYKSGNTNSGPKGKILVPIAEDKNGLIWMGDKDSGGISIFNKQTGLFSYFHSEEQNPYSLLTNKINCIYPDKTGTVWVGTIVGVNKYSPGKIKFNRYFSNPNIPDKLNNNNIHCFTESRGGAIWIGTAGGGLNKLDRKTGKFTQFQNEPNNSRSISSNTVISTCEDHEGTLWIGTYNGGLARMRDNKFESFYPKPSDPYSIADKNVWYVYEDSKMNLWVATLNNGLELFDRKTKKFYHYQTQKGEPTSLGNNTIYQLFEDRNHVLYIATSNGLSTINLNEYDFTKLPPELKFQNYTHQKTSNSISSNIIGCVSEDKEGNIWIGTLSTGVDKFDRASGLFTNYSTKDGLPGNSVSSILADDQNNLWLATDKGLAKFNLQTKETTVFTWQDGLLNTSLKSWAIKTRDGEMFFGGPDGFNSFYPENVKAKQNQNKPPVVLTGFKIFNKPVEIDEQFHNKTILTADVSETKKLELTYKENFFTFEFAALDFTTPEKNQYAYRMEGFDKEWIQSGAKHDASYTNLDPGVYTFRVKASNNDGVWNEVATSIEVIIIPQWWKTWLFRIAVSLTVIFIIGYIFYSRIQYLKNQKVRLEKLVAEKTSELQNMNTKLLKQADELNITNNILEERQAQIEQQSDELFMQKESLIVMNNELSELNATKDKFFSIIAHDIKNPFNAILGFTDLLEENFDEWTDEMKLEIISLVNKSSKNLFQLLENLLQWSRSQRGIIEFKPEKIELKETFQSIIDLMKGTVEAKNIQLDFTLPKNGLAVHADRQMLDTIMRNLISNALKFTNTGGNVHIIAEMTDGFVNIKVTDNGVGMRRDIKDKLFKIDSNQTTPGTENETGTGLGLILVKEFVEKHGGEIGVESLVGEGSTFYFTLPLAK